MAETPSNPKDEGIDSFMEELRQEPIIPLNRAPERPDNRPPLPEETPEVDEILPDNLDRRRDALISAMDHANLSDREKKIRLEDFDKKNSG